jgi:hypothetical protein
MLFNVVGCAVVLGPVVHPVVAWAPKESELTLGIATLQPVESHVHGLCALGLYVVVYYSKGCAVVSLHGSWGLLVTHFCCGTALHALM